MVPAILNNRRHLLGALQKVGMLTVFGASALIYPVVYTRSPVLGWAFACNVATFATLPITYVLYGVFVKRRIVTITGDRRCPRCHQAASAKDDRCRNCGAWFKW